jgi:hypothetical protein
MMLSKLQRMAMASRLKGAITRIDESHPAQKEAVGMIREVLQKLQCQCKQCQKGD